MARRDSTTNALMAVALAVWVVAGYFALSGPDDPPAPAPSVPEASAAQPSSVVPSASSAASPAPSASSALPGPEDLVACVSSTFEPNSLGSSGNTPSFEFVCKERDPLKAGMMMRARLLASAGKGVVTPAMRLWAGLGWYEMASFSIVRVRCCESVKPVKFQFNLACPIDKALDEWEKAVSTGDRDTIDGAIPDYHKAVKCLSQFGQSTNFGRNAPPGDDIAGLKEIIARVYPK